MGPEALVAGEPLPAAVVVVVVMSRTDSLVSGAGPPDSRGSATSTLQGQSVICSRNSPSLMRTSMRQSSSLFSNSMRTRSESSSLISA
jgi:hypothetical protein